MKIESLQNKKIKEWCKLQNKKYRDEKGLFLIEGNHLIEEAQKYNLIKETISTEKLEIENSYQVTNEIMKKLSTQKSPSNIIAVCKKKEEKEYGDRILVLDYIQDPGNLGTIIRSAVAFSYDTLILSEDTVDLYNEKVIRSTEGMLFHLNIVRRDITEELRNLKVQNYQIYGTNVKNGENLNKIKFANKIAIIIGNEGKGMNEKLEQFIDKNIYIPMNASCESLNAAISASIIMYESWEKE